MTHDPSYRHAASHAHLPGRLVDAIAPGRATLTQRLVRGASPTAPVAPLDPAALIQRHRIQDVGMAEAMGFPAEAAPVVQRHGDAHTGLDDHAVRAIASEGVAGAGSALPHLDAIQRSFGSHDVRGVRAHVGGAAAAASEALGAEAYATGSSVAFARQPSLFIAAHEAAHVVQQRAGVHFAGAVGQAGDPYEQHADAVAARVVAGESAEDLLARGGHASTVVQRKDKPKAKPAAETADEAAEEVAVEPEAEGTEAEAVMPAATAAASRGARGATTGPEPFDTTRWIDESYGVERATALQAELQRAHGRTAKAGWELARQQAIHGLERQIAGYGAEAIAFPAANIAFNAAAPIGNQAARGVARVAQLGATLGIAPDADVGALMTGDQMKSLGTAIKKNRAALPSAASMTLALNNVRAQIKDLLGAANLLISAGRSAIEKQISELKDKDAKEAAQIVAVQDEIKGYLAKVSSFIGLAMSMMSLVDMLGGSLAAAEAAGEPTPLQAEIGDELDRRDAAAEASKVSPKAARDAGEKTDTVLGPMSQLMEMSERGGRYTQLANEIASCDAILGALGESKQSAMVRGLASGFEAKSEAFPNSVKGLLGAVQDRQVAYAQIGADADADATKGTKKPSEGMGNWISDVMLYGEAVQETKGWLDAGDGLAQTATSALDQADAARAHRGEAYQTIDQIYGPATTREERLADDALTVVRMEGDVARYTALAASAHPAIDAAAAQTEAMMRKAKKDAGFEF